MAYHGLTLDADATAHVHAGQIDLPIASVPGADAREAGQPLRLVGPAGDLIGLAVADPENGLVRVFALAGERWVALDAPFFADRVDRALALRRAFGLDRLHTAHRLINGAGDGLPGLTADVYGDFAVLYVYSRGLLTLGRLCAATLRERAGVRGVVVKLRTRDAAPSNKFKQEVIGEAPPSRLVAVEDGASYEVHLSAALNVGLFTDMREHRARLARFARGRTVLNQFCYTGSLSVAAVRAGANQVTSVDLAHGVLDWSRENFRLNGLDTSGHRFVAEDVSAYLKRAAREGERFDLAIVDPPTVSAARGATWTMRRDYPALIKRTCAVLAHDGLLWLSANSRDLGSLADLARRAFVEAERTAQLLEVGGLPPDYPTPSAQPLDRYLQLCLFRVG